MKKYPKYIVLVNHKSSYQNLWSFLAVDAKDNEEAIAKGKVRGFNAQEFHSFTILVKTRKLSNGLCRYKGVARFYEDGSVEDTYYEPYNYTEIDINSIDFEY